MRRRRSVDRTALQLLTGTGWQAEEARLAAAEQAEKARLAEVAAAKQKARAADQAAAIKKKKEEAEAV